jgi:hypothetical protein
MNNPIEKTGYVNGFGDALEIVRQYAGELVANCKTSNHVDQGKFQATTEILDLLIKQGQTI